MGTQRDRRTDTLADSFCGNETDRPHSVMKRPSSRPSQKRSGNIPTKLDSYNCLTRSEQVILFILHTGHDRLNAHLFHKLKIGQSEMVPMILPKMTTEHFLQHCPLHVGLRGDTWPENRPLRERLYGDLAELKRTAAFVTASGVDV